MATFSPNNIAWLINGEPRRKEGYIDIDAGGAELGQSCANEDCKQGTCFQENDKAEEKCMYVKMSNEKGCSSQRFTTCTQGLKCVDDFCVFPNKKPPAQPKEETTSKDENEKFDKLVLYSFMIGIFVLILLMLLLLILGF